MLISPELTEDPTNCTRLVLSLELAVSPIRTSPEKAVAWFLVTEVAQRVAMAQVVRLANILCSLVVRVGIAQVGDSSTLVRLDRLSTTLSKISRKEAISFRDSSERRIVSVQDEKDDQKLEVRKGLQDHPCTKKLQQERFQPTPLFRLGTVTGAVLRTLDMVVVVRGELVSRVSDVSDGGSSTVSGFFGI